LACCVADVIPWYIYIEAAEFIAPFLAVINHAPTAVFSQIGISIVITS
jgi:hypothetical protein